MIAPVPAGYLIVIVVLGALVLIHELGHFLAALVCRLPVSRFSIGFGPALWSLRYRGVEYRLSLFPLGGYVLPGGRHPERFFDEPPRKRLLFCLGGPAANLFVAFLLLALFNVVTGSLSWQAVWGLPLAQLGVALKATLRALASLAAGDGELSGVVGVLTEGSAFVGTDTLAALQFAIVMSVNLAVLNGGCRLRSMSPVWLFFSVPWATRCSSTWVAYCPELGRFRPCEVAWHMVCAWGLRQTRRRVSSCSQVRSCRPSSSTQVSLRRSMNARAVSMSITRPASARRLSVNKIVPVGFV